MDNVISLQQLFYQRVFRVPDYQRGYSWERRHVQDFLEDLELLRPNRYHYTGTVVVHVDSSQSQQMDEEGNAYWSVDIVDGQQRLTTIVILLDSIRRYLTDHYQNAEALSLGIRKNFVSTLGMNLQPIFKISLNADTNFFWQHNILADWPTNEEASISSEQRLATAKQHIAEYLTNKVGGSGVHGQGWLQELYSKVATQLRFSLYEVETESDVGVIFEVMNNRGKSLTDLEKVKNYLLHASAVLEVPNSLGKSVNGAWAVILTQLMAANLLSSDDEDHLLRAHWLTHYDPQSRKWERSNSIKDAFDLRSNLGQHEMLLSRLVNYTQTLRDCSFSFCDAYSPTRDSSFSSTWDLRLRSEIVEWSSKLLRIGMVASFVPLLIAARTQWIKEPKKYLGLLQLCEQFAFRVYRLKGLRSNAGQATLFRLGYQLTHGEIAFEDTVLTIKQELVRLCNDEDFENLLNPQHQQMRDAYNWNGLRYFLYEYEHYLCTRANADPEISWETLIGRDRRETIEHVLPQVINDKPGMEQRL